MSVGSVIFRTSFNYYFFCCCNICCLEFNHLAECESIHLESPEFPPELDVRRCFLDSHPVLWSCFSHVKILYLSKLVGEKNRDKKWSTHLLEHFLLDGYQKSSRSRCLARKGRLRTFLKIWDICCKWQNINVNFSSFYSVNIMFLLLIPTFKNRSKKKQRRPKNF